MKETYWGKETCATRVYSRAWCELVEVAPVIEETRAAVDEKWCCFSLFVVVFVFRLVVWCYFVVVFVFRLVVWCYFVVFFFRLVVWCYFVVVFVFRLVVWCYFVVVFVFRLVVWCYFVVVFVFRLVVWCYFVVVFVFRLVVWCYFVVVFVFRLVVWCYFVVVFVFRLVVWCYFVFCLFFCSFRQVMCYRPEVRQSPEVKFATKVFNALNSNNFVRFFKLVRWVYRLCLLVGWWSVPRHVFGWWSVFRRRVLGDGRSVVVMCSADGRSASLPCGWRSVGGRSVVMRSTDGQSVVVVFSADGRSAVVVCSVGCRSVDS